MRTLRKLFGLMLTTTLACQLAGCGGGNTPKKIVLRTAEVHPADYPTTRGLHRMAEILEEKSGGRLVMDIHHGGTLGDESSTIERTKVGSIAINRISTAPLAEHAPIMKILSLPYIFRDGEHQRAVLDGPIGRECLDALEASGLIGLCYYDSGARSFYNSVRPVNWPSDLKGLRIRVQESDVMIDCVKALGASAEPMAYGEVYTAIQTGVIDGAENNPPSYETSKHFEVAKFYSLDEHSRIPEVVIMSKKVWDRLSREDQALVREAAEASVAHQRSLWAEFERKSLAAVRKGGAKINTPDRTPFREAVTSVHEKYGAQFGDLIERIRATK
jgi:tripartite ATP-independent transporter DctP family solute receptor